MAVACNTGSFGVGVRVGVDVTEGVRVGVNVEEAVGVKVGVFVNVGVSVLVGEGVTLGPNSWPGLQAERNRNRMANGMSFFMMRSFLGYVSSRALSRHSLQTTPLHLAERPC
jgi:hypothetical protein